MQTGTLINLQDASTTLVQAGAYATPIFTELVILAAVLLGVIVGGLLVRKVVGVTGSAIKTGLGLKRGGRRRRRR